jgi:hypothetical protein
MNNKFGKSIFETPQSLTYTIRFLTLSGVQLC